MAPGSSIRSAWYTGDSAFESESGTSMATPHVAGASALLLSEFGPLTPAYIDAKLDSRATTGVLSGLMGSPDRLLYTCGGINNPVVSVSGPNSRESGETGTWSASVESGAPPYTYTWFKTSQFGVTALPPTSNPATTSTSDTESFNMVVDITDSCGNFATSYIFVNVNGESGALPH